MGTVPPDIADVYEKLKTEAVWLHGRWITYRQLFAESDKRVALLNECAAQFFYIIEDTLWTEVQLTLSKLTDPARSRRFDNLSLEQLQERIEVYGDANLAVQLRQLLDELHAKCAPFRTWRNKRVAQLDLDTVMKHGASPLPGVSRRMIEEALDLVRRYMNGIERHYRNNEIRYQDFIMRGDGEALVAMLKCGLRHSELRQKRAIPGDDWRRTKWSDA